LKVKKVKSVCTLHTAIGANFLGQIRKKFGQNQNVVASSNIRSRFTCPNVRLTENVFKRISTNSNPSSKPNPKSTKTFQRKQNDVIFRASVQTLAMHIHVVRPVYKQSELERKFLFLSLSLIDASAHQRQ